MKKKNNTFNIIILIIIGIFITSLITFPFGNIEPTLEITYGEFYEQLENNNIKNLEVKADVKTYDTSGEFIKPVEVNKEQKNEQRLLEGEVSNFTTTIPQDTVVMTQLNEKIEKNEVL